MKKIIIFLCFSFFIYGCQKPEGNLIKYTKANDIKNVKNSIKESTNIDEMDSSGKTALMYAVISKNEEITELLIKEGAGINVKNDQWETPLSLATINNDINMIKLLLSKGADAKQNKEIAGLLEDDDPTSKELLNVIFEKDKQLKFLLSLQNRVFYPNEIYEIPDFVKEQKRLDSLWSFVKNIESKLSRNGISLDNFVEMCVADENENGSDYGITKEELTALGTVICLSEMCGGTTCLPKSAYKLNSNEFANRCSPGDAWWESSGTLSEVSSFLKSQSNNSYEGLHLVDNDLGTAWIEGVKGYGIGEYIVYKDVRTQADNVLHLEINNGYVKSKVAWSNNSRVKKFKIYVNKLPYGYLQLKDTPNTQHFEIPIDECLQTLKIIDDPSSTISNLTVGFEELILEITQVYKGEKYDDVAISELTFSLELGTCLAEGTLISLSRNSTVLIEHLKPGDKVLSYNIAKQRIESSAVISLASPVHDNLYKLEFDKGSIIATADHPFYVKAVGYASLDPQQSMQYVNISAASLLKEGDNVLFLSPNMLVLEATLLRIKYVKGPKKTYTITRLNKNNNFFANGFLVGVEEN